MPWESRLGHWYKTWSEVVAPELGELSREAMRKALAQFATQYILAVARVVKRCLEADSDRLSA